MNILEFSYMSEVGGLYTDRIGMGRGPQHYWERGVV